MKKIIVSKYAGFCFGVKRSLETAFSIIDKKATNERVYILGHLIHNDRINSLLESKGAVTVSEDEIDSLIQNSGDDYQTTVLLRAHGTPHPILSKLNSASEKGKKIRVIDCSCPYVKKIHKIVEENTSEGDVLFVFGDENHPEVKGIVSYSKGDSYVCKDPDDIDIDFLRGKRVIAVSQTTQSVTEWKRTQEVLIKYLTNISVYDTICEVTENRQIEAENIAAHSDAMIVIGSKSSSNTMKLFNVSEKVCKNTFLINDSSEIDDSILKSLKNADSIGITAGASTPDDIILEVKIKMSEIINESENFEKMLESSLKTLNTGDIVTGTITSITSTEVHVDLSANVTGILPYEEIQNAEPPYKVGDSIDAFVIRVSDIEGVAGLSRKRIERIEAWKKIVSAKDNKTVLEGKITKAVKGGLLVNIGAYEAFIPASQTGFAKDEDYSTLVGTIQKFNVIDIDDARKRATASIKSVQRAEHKEAVAKFWAELEVGKKFVGTVKSLTNYGAFVDLGVVDGMVHVSELSWSRIKNPAQVVSVGDSIEVFVKSFDPEKKKISLGCKTEETNPWNIFTSKYNVGDIATGKIVGITSFGAFAEIIPEIDGLIHISQIADHKIASPAEVLHLDDVVQVKIIAIDNENKKVSLSIRALNENEENSYDGQNDDGDAESPSAEAAIEKTENAEVETSQESPAEEQ